MSKNLVFTSAGDRTNFYTLWTKPTAETFDLVVYYYGDNDDNFDKYSKVAKYIEKSKGLKFQNFYKFWNNHPELSQQYDRYFILDDDLQFSAKEIATMFEVSEHYNLKICQPSFTSQWHWWQLVKHTPGILLSYTNFCEVTAPLFNKPALETFLEHYQPTLQEFGVDWLFMWSNNKNLETSFAVVHAVKCFNPPNSAKDNKREINTFSTFEHRKQLWLNYARIKKIPAYEPKIYSSIAAEKK